VVFEHIGRLDNVIIDADQNHVLFVHEWFLSSDDAVAA
jgi:hypothetical protein